jgi:mannose-6-phosphate isomerase-like protein (cupin superfamily)
MFMTAKNVASCFIMFLVLLQAGCAGQSHHHHDNFDVACDANLPHKAIVIELNNAEDYQPLLEGVPQTAGMRSGRMFLKPGQHCERHSTEAHEEMLIFLAGSGRVLLDGGVVLDVSRGRIAYIPPYLTHEVHNTGSVPLVYIYCVSPIHSSAN